MQICAHILVPTSYPISRAGNPAYSTSPRFGAQVESNYIDCYYQFEL